MPSRSIYHTTISNSYLQVSRVIRASSRQDLALRVNEQLARWAAQERLQRERIRRLGLQALAEQEAHGAHQRISDLRQVLASGLAQGRQFQWEALKDQRTSPPFRFVEPMPSYLQVAARLRVPAPNDFVEALMPSARQKRQQAEARAHYEYNLLLAQWQARRQQVYQVYEQQRQAFEQGKAQFNDAMDEKQRRFQEGDPEAVVWVLRYVLDRLLQLPAGYGKDFDVAFDRVSGTAIITIQLPSVDEIPTTSGYRADLAHHQLIPIQLRPSEIEELHDALVAQVALRILHLCFLELDTQGVRRVVLNGWAAGIDAATGSDIAPCVLSVSVERDIFRALRLDRVDPVVCLTQTLKARAVLPFGALTPVQLLADPHAIAQGVGIELADTMGGIINLATLDWALFEELVADLLRAVYQSSTVQVTRTRGSRDGGIDVLVHDPDRIKGGTTIVQVKRYSHVVSIETVRALLGTMPKFNASKAILVTTSHYGPDARMFVKDTPVTLIDGRELLELLRQHGYNVQIDFSGIGTESLRNDGTGDPAVPRVTV